MVRSSFAFISSPLLWLTTHPLNSHVPHRVTLTSWAFNYKPTFLLGVSVSSGRFVAPQDGVYSFHANVRVDGVGSGYIRVLISKNGSQDPNDAVTSIQGSLATNYDSIVCGGTMIMKAGDYVTLSIYSSADNAYSIYTDSSFGGAYLGPPNMEAFRADKNGNQIGAVGWFEVSNYRIAGVTATSLFSNAPTFNITSGRYTIKTAGVYLVNANIRIDSGADGYFRLMMQVKNNIVYDNGMTVLSGDISSSCEIQGCALVLSSMLMISLSHFPFQMKQ